MTNEILTPVQEATKKITDEQTKVAEKIQKILEESGFQMQVKHTIELIPKA